MPLARDKQKQIWSDKEFIAAIKRIKAKKQMKLNGEVVSIADITRDIVKAPSFKAVEEEILGKKFVKSLKMRLDKKGLF